MQIGARRVRLRPIWGIRRMACRTERLRASKVQKSIGASKLLVGKSAERPIYQDSDNPTSSRSSLVILYALEIRELISV